MNFRPELAEKVMAGEKTVTRRLVSENPRSPWWRERCAYQPGKVFTVNPGRGQVNIGTAVVIDVCLVPLDPISDDEARAEGFEDAAAFWDAFNAINKGKDVDPGTDVWRISFEPVGVQLELAGATS